MKKLSQLNEAKISVQDDSINFIPGDKLRQYKEIAKKFLSDDAIYIIDWLIDNNKDYVKTLSKGKEGNALEIFYNGSVPKDPELKELYKHIGKIVKNNRLMEIPVFQTEETFNDILAKKISPDEVIIDLSTERGRNAVAKKYDKLVWKVARSFQGKSNLTLDELYSAGMEGLTNAMNNYGKKTERNNVEEESIKAYTFLSYAAYMIRMMILADIQNHSHTVRIPVSAQKKEREETGRNTKTTSVSGDAVLGSDSSGNSKTMFDLMGADAGSEDGGRGIDGEDIEQIWKTIFKTLEDKFDERTMDIWYSFNELNGRERMQNKELAKKYDMIPSRVTYYLFTVNNYIQNNKKLKDLFGDLRELMAESVHNPVAAI